jgi:hypothetical protein
MPPSEEQTGNMIKGHRYDRFPQGNQCDLGGPARGPVMLSWLRCPMAVLSRPLQQPWGAAVTMHYAVDLSMIIGSSRLPASKDFHMTSRFPGPWRIAEFPNGFAVYDATGRQLGFFYGRAYPNPQGHAGFLMVEEARQIAVDFARLPELLNQTSARSEVATSPEDDKFAKLETNRSPQDVPETSRLPHAAHLSVITVTGSPLAEAPTTIRRSIPFEPDRRRSTRMLRRRRDPVSIRTKFLIAIAVAALPAGYFMFESSDRRVDVAVARRSTADIPRVEFLPLREAQAPTAVPPAEFLPLQAPTPAAVSTYAESPIEREIQTAPSTVPLDIKSTENGIEARPPQTLPQKEGQSFAPSQDASTCLPSASAVRQNHPGRWPSWTLKAPGHEGTRCWYAATRPTAHDHP